MLPRNIDYNVSTQLTYKFSIELISFSGTSTEISPVSDSISELGSIYVEGYFKKSIINNRSDASYVKYEFYNLDIESTFPSIQSNDTGSLSKNDSLIIIASYFNDGRILGLAFKNFKSILLRNSILAFLSNVQVVVSKESQLCWQVREDHPNGIYVVNYIIKDTTGKEKCSSGIELQKNIKRTVHIRSDSQKNITISPITQFAGGINICYDPLRRIILNCEGQQSQEIKIGKRTITRTIISIKSSLINLQEKDITSNKQYELFSIAELRKPSSSYFLGRNNENDQFSIKDTSTAENILYIIETINKNELEGGKTLTPDIIRRLSHSLLFRNDSYDLLEEKVNHSSGMSLLTRYAVSTMCEIGNRKSQEILLRILRKHIRETEAMQKLLPLLLRLKEPTDELISFLILLCKSKKEQIATQAQLVSGAIARNISAISRNQYDKILDHLIGNVNKDSLFLRNKTTLLALGNSGSIRILKILEPLTRSKDPHTRCIAIRCMRWIDTIYVDSVLSNALLHDVDLNVRLEAAGVYELRPSTSVGIMSCKESAKYDINDDVRVRSLVSLWEFREEDDEICALIKNIAKMDPVEKVKSRAKRLVDSNPEYFED